MTRRLRRLALRAGFAALRRCLGRQAGLGSNPPQARRVGRTRRIRAGRKGAQ
jgi:hypothetical protein